jgi:histidinol-phosphate aminotransferase
MIQASDFVRPHVLEMEAYQPIFPFEVLSQKLGLEVDEIVKLDANENPYGPHSAVLEALGNLPFPYIYPDPESSLLRRALSAYLDMPEENLLAGAGADELIDLVMRLVLEPGDVVINCPPTFSMYAFDAGIHNARVVNVKRNSDFTLNLPAIETAVGEHNPKIIFICSPNNPDGGIIPLDDLESLLSLPLIIVLDEAYIEFGPPESSRIKDVLSHGNLIVLRTFSKWAGLAGLRVGYGVFPLSLMPHLWKIKQPYNVSVAGAVAARVSIEHAEELEIIGHRLVLERERLFEGLQIISYLEPYPSQANFILCRVVGRDAKEFKEALSKIGILVRYFDKPGIQDHIRISIGKPEHTDKLMEVLAKME